MSDTNRPTTEAAEEILGKYFPVLDHGFVSLVDYMGTDKCIESAARVSYGAGTRKKSATRGLLRYLRRNMHCYDESTEVLTDRGFVLWPEVTENDKLGTWDENKQSLFYEVPEYLVKKRYCGKMYRINHKKISLLVTPEHKMYVDKKKWCNIRNNMFWSENKRLISAKALGDCSMVRYFKSAPKLEDNYDFNNPIFNIGSDLSSNLKLIGFFIGDGHANKSLPNSISFHLKKERKIKFLREICLKSNFELKEQKSNSYIVYKKGLGNLFLQFYDEEKKKQIPPSLMNLDQSKSLALINGLLNSDGAKKRKTFEYSSNSRKLIESIQIVGLHAGYAININKPQKGMYRLMLMTNPDAVVNQGAKNTSWEDYDGHVYCAKTRTGILVIRRKGKIVLSGNSTPSEMIEFKFHCCMPIFTARQWIRHRTACLSSDVELWFDEPAALKNNKRKRRNMSIGEVYLKWNKNHHLQNVIKKMNLRSLNEDNKEIIHTNITDIWSNGIKKVFKVTFENNYSIKMTEDHLCFTNNGWKTLKEASGLRLGKKNVTWKKDCDTFATNGIPVYQSYEWLKSKRNENLNVTQIASAAGCSYHTIRKWLKINNLQFTPKEKAYFSGQTQRGTKRNSRKRGPLTGKALENVRKARSGPNSNFWKGGVSADRSNIGRWTTENSRRVFEIYNFQCQICKSKQKLNAHHIDPVWNNIEKARDINNLIALCAFCHRSIHNNNCELDFLNAFNKGNNLENFLVSKKIRPRKKTLPKPNKLACVFQKIKKIEYVGEEEVFDLSVAGPFHNFVANGIVVHNSVNEYSGRYSLMPMQFYMPDHERMKKQSEINNQGSGDKLVDPKVYADAVSKWNSLREQNVELYSSLNEEGLARELSRIDLPLSTYTQWYWKIDLHNLLHFLTLRVDSHAQWEIQEYGKIMAGMLKRVAPISYEAWIDYNVCGEKMSRMEMEILHEILSFTDYIEDSKSLDIRPGGRFLLLDEKESEMSTREMQEFATKLNKIRETPDFELDLSTAKTGKYFEEKMKAAVI